MNDDNVIYTIYMKYIKDDVSQIKLLKKAFKEKTKAIEYIVKKINEMLKEISNDYKLNNENKILPIKANVIYTIYENKVDLIEKYEYFLSEYKNFFNYISGLETMFFISEHIIIN